MDAIAGSRRWFRLGICFLFLVSSLVANNRVAYGQSRCDPREPGCRNPSGTPSPCAVEDSIFRRAETDRATAIRGTIYLRNRDLNPNCTGHAFSTAHISTLAGGWIEIGWWESNSGVGPCTPQCPHYWRIFWEVGQGGNAVGGAQFYEQVGCCDWIPFRIEHVPNTQRWKLFFDYGADGGFVQVGPSGGVETNFRPGNAQTVPMAETSRYGGTATGASDHHNNLRRKINCYSCEYGLWTNNNLHYDNMSGWTTEDPSGHPHWYKIIQGGS